MTREPQPSGEWVSDKEFWERPQAMTQELQGRDWVPFKHLQAAQTENKELRAEVGLLRGIITDLLWEIGLGYDAKEVIARARAAMEPKP
jgi:hypothetical protein